MPYDQVVRDRHCSSSLEGVIIVPWLDDLEERWTEKHAALENFIVPLTEHIFKTYEGLDGNRVTVAGASLGSGMALQLGLLRPDLFSTIVAGGFADGSHCAGDDPNSPAIPFDITKLPSADEISETPEDKWKLKLITIIMGENELLLDSKLTSLFDVFDNAVIPTRTSMHLRLYGGANHPQCSIMGFNQWKGLHRVFWGIDGV